MQRPGFWDDQEAAARTSAAHARAQRRLKMFRGLESDVADLERPRRDGGRRRGDGGRAEHPAGVGREAPRGAGRGAPVQRRVRRRRRCRQRPRRRRRHRLPGLGRNPPAHVPALGGAARLRGRDEGGLAGGGGRAEVGDLHRPRRERLRAVRRRARRPPAGPDLPLRLLRAPPHQLRPGRRRPAGRRGSRRRDRRRRSPGRHLPGLRRRRPARQQDRLGGADHAPSDRRRRPVPERALADPEQGGGDAAAALEADRAGGAQTRRGAGQGARRGQGRRLGLADPQLLPAPGPAGQGPPHRPRGRRRPARAGRRHRRLHPRLPQQDGGGLRLPRRAGCRKRSPTGTRRSGRRPSASQSGGACRSAGRTVGRRRCPS